MPYTLNGQPAQVAEEPHDQNGTIYVPFKQVVDALGGSVVWDNETKMASATLGQWTASFMLAADTADVNGQPCSSPRRPMWKAGSCTSPPRSSTTPTATPSPPTELMSASASEDANKMGPRQDLTRPLLRK